MSRWIRRGIGVALLGGAVAGGGSILKDLWTQQVPNFSLMESKQATTSSASLPVRPSVVPPLPPLTSFEEKSNKWTIDIYPPKPKAYRHDGGVEI